MDEISFDCEVSVVFKVDGKERALRARWNKDVPDQKIGEYLRRLFLSARQTVAVVVCSEYKAMGEPEFGNYYGSRSLEDIKRAQEIVNG